MDAVRVLAFYLPQFHPTPENDLWWGAGFTEWTNVVKARPSYAGHYQPHLPADLGFYDLRTPDALRRQALLARRYGIEGFCVYYYNFGSRRVLSQPLETVRANPDIPFRWCLCWANENWTKHWDGGEREILLEQSYEQATLDAIIADAVAQAADPRYIRVNGRPLFLVYRPLLLPDPPGFAAQCRAAFARCRVRRRASGLCREHGGGRPRGAPGRSRLRRLRRVSAARPRGAGHHRRGDRQGRLERLPLRLSRHGDGVRDARHGAVCRAIRRCSRAGTTRRASRCAAPASTPSRPEAFRVYVEEKIEEIRQLPDGRRAAAVRQCLERMGRGRASGAGHAATAIAGWRRCATPWRRRPGHEPA